ncbi:MAG: methyltransferase domain-containing protein [Phaeodactylibacter sp.]|nr:methyltransferase domain-containing protein [Phaeodactylibacter sp.]MCB9293993.1 methyltransferase domain-containing protein [Lewinellaceae bacterium]
MLQIAPFEKHVAEYDEWFEKHPFVYETELAALRRQMLTLPENLVGLEVGVGTGRYAAPLGIKEGVEPSEEMAKRAVRRGVEVVNARAEKLPYRDIHFDFVLIVTICHLDKVPEAFAEAYRVLKPGGVLIVGFLDGDGVIAKRYEERRNQSTFYRHATFYRVNRVEEMLKKAGFANLQIIQTLFGELEEINEVQDSRQGYGEGSFVVVKAVKKLG